jgi:hypothetical protein
MAMHAYIPPRWARDPDETWRKRVVQAQGILIPCAVFSVIYVGFLDDHPAGWRFAFVALLVYALVLGTSLLLIKRSWDLQSDRRVRWFLDQQRIWRATNVVPDEWKI